MSSKLILRAAGGLALLALASGCGDMELPPPPDMSELVQAYSEPSGDLDPSIAVDFGKRLVDTLVENRNSAPIEVAGALVGNLQDLGGGEATDGEVPADAGAGAQEVNGSRIDIAAIARVHRICRGWGAEPLNEAENGSLDLTATLDQRGLIPTIWGSANNCRFTRGDTSVQMDGDVRIHFGDGEPRVGLRYLKEVGYLFTFEGVLSLTKGEQHSELELRSHFKAFATGEVWILLTLSDGTRVIAVVDTSALNPGSGQATLTLGVLGRDERWQCTVNTDTGSGSCTSNENSVVSW